MSGFKYIKTLFQASMIVCAMALGASGHTYAQSAPVQFEADQVESNQETGTLIATGNVVLIQEGAELRADRLDYDRKTESAVATGHVIYKTADGAIHMTDYLDLSDNFKMIFAEPLISDLSDGSRFTAEVAEGEISTKIEMTSSRFTPCDCDFEAGESPIWDLRATKTTHNKETATIIHENVRMHIFGVPVFYLPVLAHPDASVKRRTGFLAPSVVYSTSQGSTVTTPYYKTLGPSADITLRPYIFQHRGQAIHSVYRQRTDYSDLAFNLYAADVATYKKERESVGAVDIIYNTQVGDDWKINARLIRTSQDTFMRRYKFNTDYNLKSEIKAERIKKDRYYLVEASDLQAVRASDTPDKEPSILPHIYYESYSDGFREGQKVRTEISAIHLSNDDGNDMVRWSSDVSLQEEYQFLGGSLDAELGVAGSVYDIQNTSDDTKHNGELGQVNPYVSLDWRAPVSAISDVGVFMFEPRAKFTHIDGTDRTQEIPNRDASDFRLDEANLFLTHRQQGKDFVLPGTRADIGISFLADQTIFGDVSGFGGISRRIAGETADGLTTTDNKDYSDYIANVAIKPYDGLSISWSGRADSDDYELNESRTNLSWRYKSSKINIEHAQLSKAHFKSSETDREALSASLSQSLPEGWELQASQNWDLSNGKTQRDKTRFTLAWTGGFQDCLTLSLDYQRDATSDRDIPRKDEIFLVLNFKYLGAISQSDFQKDN